VPVVIVFNIKQDAPPGDIEPVAQAPLLARAPVGELRAPRQPDLQKFPQVGRKSYFKLLLRAFHFRIGKTRIELNFIAQLKCETAPIGHDPSPGSN